MTNEIVTLSCRGLQWVEGLLEMRILFVGLCSPLSVEIIDFVDIRFGRLSVIHLVEVLWKCNDVAFKWSSGFTL